MVSMNYVGGQAVVAAWWSCGMQRRMTPCAFGCAGSRCCVLFILWVGEGGRAVHVHMHLGHVGGTGGCCLGGSRAYQS